MKNIRIGSGFDVHAFEEEGVSNKNCVGSGQYVTLGGIKIPHSKGLVAHSDGDVVVHALCDAILGALSKGDIGAHFPDNSLEFKGIDSRILLEKVCTIMRAEKYDLGNADITVCAERPKLRDHIELMCSELARVMGADRGDVSVKATTTEKLGFVGRSEGIAVFSTVLLFKVD